MDKADYSGYTRYLWGLKVPLPKAWADYSTGTNILYRDRALAYWIDMSRDDPWTFDQLGDLVGALMDVGESVPALDQWAREVASRRVERPNPKGRKRVDRSEDARIVFAIVGLTLFGKSRREACRIIGEVLHKSPEAVESAWRRYNETV